MQRIKSTPVEFFPLICSIIIVVFLSICFGLTISNNHIPRGQFVPLISDTGSNIPEYGVFIIGTLIGAIGLSIAGIIIYKLNRGSIYALEIQDPLKILCITIKFKYLNWFNKLIFFNSQVSAISLALLGIVNLNISFWTHATFALIFFICNFSIVHQLTIFYCLIIRWDNRKNSFVTQLRLANFWLKIKIFCTIMCVLSLPCNGPIVWLIVKQKFSLDDPDLYNSVAICQYVYVIFMLIWFSTHYKEFKGVTLGAVIK